MRQISLFNATATRQMHILTTRADLPAAEIRYRMGSRWRQENHYRYARIHFDLDSHDTYRAAADDPDRMVPNPAKKPAYRDVENACRALYLAETASDAALLAAHSPQPGTSVVLTAWYPGANSQPPPGSKFERRRHAVEPTPPGGTTSAAS